MSVTTRRQFATVLQACHKRLAPMASQRDSTAEKVRRRIAGRHRRGGHAETYETMATGLST